MTAYSNSSLSPSSTISGPFNVRQDHLQEYLIFFPLDTRLHHIAPINPAASSSASDCDFYL